MAICAPLLTGECIIALAFAIIGIHLSWRALSDPISDPWEERMSLLTNHVWISGALSIIFTVGFAQKLDLDIQLPWTALLTPIYCFFVLFAVFTCAYEAADVSRKRKVLVGVYCGVSLLQCVLIAVKVDGFWNGLSAAPWPLALFPLWFLSIISIVDSLYSAFHTKEDKSPWTPILFLICFSSLAFSAFLYGQWTVTPEDITLLNVFSPLMFMLSVLMLAGFIAMCGLYNRKALTPLTRLHVLLPPACYFLD
eukprot:TRINITY_DN3788_c0_g1_i1.p1 TRINITY_DN3788_c0_g1~~TRINITY_DN3788_c0_g1_i1.p1  ORF type:complete len:252 (-),score=47.66 TRINITY_DN3788_c0_g1_i1:102-857(-)